MNKPIIAVDIDEVLVPHFQGLIDWYNREYGTRLTLANNHPTDPKPWGTDSVEVAVKRVRRYFETGSFKSEQPFPETFQVLEFLRSNYKLVAVTGRDDLIEEATRRWLEGHFKGLFSAAYFTAQYSLEGKARSKTEVAREVGAAYFIEDSFKTAAELARVGIKTILFGDYPWSQIEELPEGVTRCKDWRAVKEYFDEQG